MTSATILRFNEAEQAAPFDMTQPTQNVYGNPTTYSRLNHSVSVSLSDSFIQKQIFSRSYKTDE